MTKTFSGRRHQFIASGFDAWILARFVLQSSIGEQPFKHTPRQSPRRKIFKPTKSYFPGALRPGNSKEQGRAFQKRSCPFFSGVSNRHLRQRVAKAGSRNSVESRSLRFGPTIS